MEGRGVPAPLSGSVDAETSSAWIGHVLHEIPESDPVMATVWWLDADDLYRAALCASAK